MTNFVLVPLFLFLAIFCGPELIVLTRTVQRQPSSCPGSLPSLTLLDRLLKAPGGRTWILYIKFSQLLSDVFVPTLEVQPM